RGVELRLATIIDYLTERWDEEEDDLDRLMNMRHQQRYLRENGYRLLADITAKRKTLAECRAAIGRDGDDAALARNVLNLLAEPYTDRADFQAPAAPAHAGPHDF